MVDSKRFNDWYLAGEKDLKGAKILCQYDADYGIVAFHCQQAIEKCLKGYLLEKASELVEGHSLIYLCKRARVFDSAFASYMKDCAFVNQFYLETRYPADMPMLLEQDEAEECIAIAEQITNFVKGKTTD